MWIIFSLSCLFYVLVFWAQGMWDLSSLTRNQTCAPCIGIAESAWKIPWTEEPGGLQSMGSLRVRHNWVTSLSCIGEGNGNPLQCSCLENPRDSRAWWAAVCGVEQSRTRLKRLSSSSSSSNHWSAWEILLFIISFTVSGLLLSPCIEFYISNIVFFSSFISI